MTKEYKYLDIILSPQVRWDGFLHDAALIAFDNTLIAQLGQEKVNEITREMLDMGHEEYYKLKYRGTV